MTSTRLIGPDHLEVQSLPLDGAVGVWARFYGVQGDAGLVATRRGAVLGAFAGPSELAAVINLDELEPAGHR